MVCSIASGPSTTCPAQPDLHDPPLVLAVPPGRTTALVACIEADGEYQEPVHSRLKL